MKTAEEKVKKVGIYPEDFISSSGYLAVVNLVNDLDQKASYELKTAIDLLSKSDQQNKELRDELSKMKAMFDFDKTRAEITRLTKENKELEEKLMSEQIENGYLQAFRVSNEAEIQRLREGVEELKNDLLDALDLKNGNGPTALTMLSNEITRLRELLGETLKWLQWSSHSDAQLLASKIDNALNHKP